MLTTPKHLLPYGLTTRLMILNGSEDRDEDHWYGRSGGSAPTTVVGWYREAAGTSIDLMHRANDALVGSRSESQGRNQS